MSGPGVALTTLALPEPGWRSEMPERIRRTPLERFMAKVSVDQSSGCWVWTAALDSTGRPCFKADGAMRIAYRWFYETVVGPIPCGLELDHMCNIPRCVNLAHLEPVTRRENMRRRYAPVVACVNGHPYDEANTMIRKNGTRACRLCAYDRKVRYLKRKAAS